MECTASYDNVLVRFLHKEIPTNRTYICFKREKEKRWDREREREDTEKERKRERF